MSLAKRVQQTIAAQCPVTFSLYAGYGLGHDSGGNAKCVRFPIGAQQAMRRNKSGRCTHAEYRYADNSVLIYAYNEARGYTITTKESTQ